MRIAHLTWLLSPNGGGIPAVVFAVDAAQRALGHQVAVLGVSDPRAEPEGPAEVFPAVGPLALGLAPGLRGAVERRNPDVVHLHGLFTWSSRVADQAGQRTSAPVVITPHGMLDPWALAHSRWKKRAFRALVEDANLARAACLQALCEAEVEHFRVMGLRNPVAVVPNGVALPTSPGPSVEPFLSRFPIARGRRILLFLGRIHPKKGLLNLVDAWAVVKRDRAAAREWLLVIAGPDQLGHSAEVGRRVTGHGLGTDAVLIGPVAGELKGSVFAASSAFVLPSFSEGLPMAVLEAMSQRLPVIVTRECNLDVEVFGGGMVAESTVSSLARRIEAMIELRDRERLEMGERGRREVEARYTWARVSEDLVATYRYVLGEAARPPFVDGRSRRRA